jgi:hypothetical protein
MTWLVRDPNERSSLVKVLRRVGIDMSRERMSWGGLEPQSGKFDWENGGMETLRREYARCGVKMLEMFHDAPAWTGAVKGNPYPKDLPAAFRSWSAIAARWSNTWAALEVWNEPDIFFGGDAPADQYIPLVKTIAYALDQGGAKTPLVGGVFTDGCPPVFRQGCADNGLLDHCDAISFHNYRSATSIEPLVAVHRAWLKSAGKESMPLWITESGRPWKRGPARPPTDQDAASALDIVAQAVQARACGIQRHFCFVYPYYDENDNNFGMMGKEGTPLRSMGAYAQCVAALSGLRYLGDLPIDEGGAIKRARVFGDDKTAVAVIYTGQTKPDAAVRLKFVPDRIAGIDGRTLAAASDGATPIPDGLTYVWADRARIAPLLKTDTPAAALYASSQKPPPRRAAPSPLVLQYVPDPNRVSAAKHGYDLVDPDPGRFPLAVRVTNLSSEPRRLRVSVKPAPGAKAAEAKPVAVVVSAGGSADVEIPTDLRQFLLPSARSVVTVLAEGDGVGAASPLVVSFRLEVSLEDALKLFPVKKALPVSELDRWRKNIVGDGQMSMSVTPEGHWRLEAKFDKGDPWVYPHFALAAKDLPRPTALVVRARCEGAAAIRVMLHEKAGTSHMTGASIMPGDGKWHVAVIPLRDLTPPLPAEVLDARGAVDLAGFDSIQVGLNSKSADKRNVLTVSDVYLVAE